MIPRRRLRPITIEDALRDKHLLGAALGEAAPWRTWFAILRAAFGLSLNREQRRIFDAVAGGREPPQQKVRELWCIIGRRGGKSRMAAALAVYLALFQQHKLVRGEQGFVLVLAASRDQARVVVEYIKAFLEASDILRNEIESVTTTEIKLRNNVVITTHAASFRSIRGRTLVACVFDEIALWRDETSAYPDIGTYRAILPSLMTTQGMLIAISTPYRRTGLLHQKHRDFFNVDSNEILVVQGASSQFNPMLAQAQIDAAIAADREGATSEWEATFRSDLAAFLDDTTIEAAVDYGRPLELPPRTGTRYYAFCDPSGGRHDAFTLCIGHRESELFVADVIRGKRPPFDPHQVVKDYAALAREYRCSSVHGDRYSAEWVTTSFKAAGISYKPSEKSKSDLYLESLPIFTRSDVSIPDFAPLLRELRLLERAAHKGGRDSVDHPRNGSDDFANSLCGCAVLARKPGYSWDSGWLDQAPPPEPPEMIEARRKRLYAMLLAGQEIPF
jgi:hypothetical protein